MTRRVTFQLGVPRVIAFCRLIAAYGATAVHAIRRTAVVWALFGTTAALYSVRFSAAPSDRAAAG
jgi:hypothetical protein